MSAGHYHCALCVSASMSGGGVECQHTLCTVHANMQCCSYVVYTRRVYWTSPICHCIMICRRVHPHSPPITCTRIQYNYGRGAIGPTRPSHGFCKPPRRATPSSVAHVEATPTDVPTRRTRKRKMRCDNRHPCHVHMICVSDLKRHRLHVCLCRLSHLTCGGPSPLGSRPWR